MKVVCIFLHLGYWIDWCVAILAIAKFWCGIVLLVLVGKRMSFVWHWVIKNKHHGLAFLNIAMLW